METWFEVRVKETNEIKTFDTVLKAREWAREVVATFSMWGGHPAIEIYKYTRQII